MARRDPNKTARNRKVAAIKEQRRELLPHVLEEIAPIGDGCYDSEASLNAFIGSKTDTYINLKDEIIKTPMEYMSKWISGLKKTAIDPKIHPNSSHKVMNSLLSGDFPHFRRYVSLFLEGSFLKHYEEHYKKKPKITECEYWFGNNSDEFGFLITPRFVRGVWENDKSEIRHFKYPYWTIAHVLESGFVYMNENRIRSFSNIEDYLQFFRDLVRRTNSVYQLEIADRYIEYAQEHQDPLGIPILLPELRYDPFKTRHIHRLDYLIINPWSMEKFGFEISPWSTHGKLKGRGRKMAAYDQDAQANFEKEMRKHKRYWRKYGVSYITYTDEDLEDMNRVWDEIRACLEIADIPDQLELALIEELNL